MDISSVGGAIAINAEALSNYTVIINIENCSFKNLLSVYQGAAIYFKGGIKPNNFTLKSSKFTDTFALAGAIFYAEL